MRILIIDDQRSARRVLKQILLKLDNVELLEAGTLQEACVAIEKSEPDLLLVDIRLSDEPTDRGGLELLRWLQKRRLDTPAVMITASTELAEIREAMRLGAKDYVLKDELCAEMLLPIIMGLSEKLSLRKQVHHLRAQVDSTWGPAALVGSSPRMQRVRHLVERVASSDAPVLILGETGTGKEMVARAIHTLSERRDEPFLPVNCSALPGTLIESLIFGHVRGAFTGADKRMRGQFELAGRGTVLLDEIAEMPGATRRLDRQLGVGSLPVGLILLVCWHLSVHGCRLAGDTQVAQRRTTSVAERNVQSSEVQLETHLDALGPAGHLHDGHSLRNCSYSR